MRPARLLWILLALRVLASPPQIAGQPRCGTEPAADEPSFPDLYCIDLYGASGVDGIHGAVHLRPAAGPFGVAVTKDGAHRYDLVAEIEGLPEPEAFGPYGVYVAWAMDPGFRTVYRLGPVGNGVSRLGEIALNKFLIVVSAEASSSVGEREGRLVLRGQSPSNLLQPHDLLSLSPLAAFAPDEAAHRHGEWQMPPMHPKVPMAPGMAHVTPSVAPMVPHPTGFAAVPEALPRRMIDLADGDSLRLVSGLVRRTLKGLPLLMYAFNGQHPGPLLMVRQRATVVVEFENRLPHATAVHWHGIRLDNRFDGVPGVTQEPVQPGESFTYRVHFPDAGIYWYHPHHREDIQQDLGLYGNLVVRSSNSDFYNPVNREEVLMLDDLLLGDEGLVPYGRESANFMLMGRFGNVFLVNGEPGYELEVDRGEVVRFFLTNVSNTRTFNLSIGDLAVKVVGSDVGRFERESWSRNVVIAPAERYIVEAMFNSSGTFALTNRVQALSHRTGTFFPEIDTLGLVRVGAHAADPDFSGAFETLREHGDVQADVDAYRRHFTRAVDRELVMTLEVADLPPVVQEMMRLDPIYFNPVEWSDTMPMMNWISTGNEVRWVLRDPATGAENMDIDWRFRTGDVVKILVRNDRNAFHAMQHPLHVHGQRFLVLTRNGVPTENFVWKDTVLLPVGSETELLVDLANPGRWMVHCHIAEHLESGMKMVIDVRE